VKRTRRGSQDFQVSGDAVYPPGHDLEGEPVRERPSTPRMPARKGEVYGFPELAAARARVMGRKMIGDPAMPGDVPDDGGGLGSSGRPTGSRLPVVAASRSIPHTSDVWARMVGAGEVVAPPYDPWLLVCAVEESDALADMIDAMATNIGGFGYDLKPQFPTRDEQEQPVDPPPGAEAERAELELFLASCNLKLGLEGVMDHADRDVETTGNGYVEALRDTEGRVAQLEPLPSFTMRLGRLSQPQLVEVPFRHPTTDEIVILPRYQRFRTFLQERDGRVVCFKEFGDPRAINSQSGEFKAPGESWGVDKLGNSLDGTEVIHVSIYATHSPYGVPRWIGAMPHVRVSREAGDLVVRWFEDAPIGAKMMMIAGGSWKSSSVKSALDRIDDMARGKENSFSIIAIEGEPTGADDPIDETKDAAPRILVEDLTFELPEWVIGENSVVDQSRTRLGRTFRLPPIYWGASTDYSRAAANTARAVSEEQVFVPLRRLRWGSVFNNCILPSMGINFWRLQLRGANTSDDASDGVSDFTAGGGTSPNSLIKLWNERNGTDEALIGEPWGDRPLELTIALINKGLDPNKSLEELAADVKEQADQAAQMAADQAAARQGATADGKPAGGKPGTQGEGGNAPPADDTTGGNTGARTTVQKAEAASIAAAVGLADLRSRLLEEIERRRVRA
jgi:PBSX family phage portal protein